MQTVFKGFSWTLFLVLQVLAWAVGSDAPVKKLTIAVDKVMVVIFENTNYKDALAQPFFASFAKRGALFDNFDAETHPSQGNYIALASGDLHEVTGDGLYDLNSKNIVDLLEAKGKTWKVYAEAYPGNCFLGETAGTYARKHNPLISFTNIQRNPSRCTNIVDASQLDKDIQAGTLPNFSIYIPDINNDGHDTSVSFADKWFNRVFSPRISDARFMNGMLLIPTFDESGFSFRNQIYTAFLGDSVQPGFVSHGKYNHYNILRTVEDIFGLGTLGLKDAQAAPISDVFKTKKKSRLFFFEG